MSRRSQVLCFIAVALSPILAAPAWAKKPAEETEAKPSLAALVEGAQAFKGLLNLYRTPDELYLEVPEELIGAPLGFAAIQVNALGDFALRGGALETQLVRWNVVGDRLALYKENIDFRADPGSPMVAVLHRAFPDSPAFSGPRVELSDAPRPNVVDASDLFGDLTEILSRRSGFEVDTDAAMLDSIKAFPDNVVVRVRYPLRRTEGGGPSDDEDDDFARFLRPGRLADDRLAEAIVDYNFYRLPEDDFEPRFEDERVGGFGPGYKDYTTIDDRDTLFRHLLSRWDVRRPITFTLDRSVPEKWRQPIREAAEWWNPVFAAAGIPNAVRVLDPPDDPDWDPADIRYSPIYWNIADNLMFSGAAGPSLVDPRNGKVLKANVYLNGEFFSFALHRYLVYAWWRAPEPGATRSSWEARRAVQEALRGDRSLCDRAASFSSQLAFARLVLRARGVLQQSPAEAERFAREAFDELVAHEVGHALGFPHNWKASLISSWEDVRDGKVSGLRNHNIFSSSVMDYNPIYFAPKGKPQGDYFMREAGPYDYLAVEYLYRPFDGLSAEEKARDLDRIAARAETEYGMVYDSGELGFADPTTNSDDFGNDPLAFAESRLAILEEEVLPRLDELVLDEGHDYSLLRQALDAAIFSVAMDYIDIVSRHVGGQILLRRRADSAAAPSGGPLPITPVPAATQRRALEVLSQRIFREGAFALPPRVLAELKADLQFDWNYPWRYASDYNVGTRIAGLYDAALSTLLEPARLARILDNERRVAAGDERFTLPELFDGLVGAGFGGVEKAGPIPVDRRALQRLLVDQLAGLVLSPEHGTPAEASQLAALTLRRLGERLAAAPQGTGYRAAHLGGLRSTIDKALEAGYEIEAP